MITTRKNNYLFGIFLRLLYLSVQQKFCSKFLRDPIIC